MKKIYSIRTGLLAASLIPLGAALLIPVVFILSAADFPARTLAVFFTGPWSTPWFLGNTLDSMTLLLCASLGSAAAFRGGCFNLGGEGQMYLGGCAAAVVLTRSVLPGPLALVFAALAAALTGGLMGGIPGLLRKHTGANELITSFLLAAALVPAGDFLVSALRSPGANLLATDRFAPDRLLPKLLLPSALSVSIIVVLILAGAFHLFFNHTAAGYRFRIAGAAPDLARFGGIDAEKRFFPAMAASGGMAGLTGFFAVAGTYGMCYQGFSGGVGWNGIALALIAGNEPLLILPAVFFFNAVRAGAGAAMLQAGFGFETAAFIQAAVLLLAALPFGSRYLAGREP